MFKTFLKFFTTTCLLYIHANPIEGLQCFHCYYLQGAFFDKDFTMGDPSCEFGKQPRRSLDCDIFEMGTNATGKTFSCLTVKLDGQSKIASKANSSFTTRTCLLHPPESQYRPARKSYYNSTSEIRTLLTLAKGRKIFADILDDFKDSAHAEAWTCDENKCNGFKQAGEHFLMEEYAEEGLSEEKHIDEEAYLEQDGNEAVFQSIPSKHLNCYLCEYQENFASPDANLMRLDPSCAAGKTPKPEFSTNCGELDYYGNDPYGTYIGVPKGLGGYKTVNLTNLFIKFEATYSCITFSLDGESMYSGESEKRSARFCAIFSGANDHDKCYEQDVSQLDDVIEEPWWKSLTETLPNQYTANTKISICSCFSDDCNGAERPSAVAIHINVLRIAIGIQSMYYLFLNL